MMSPFRADERGVRVVTNVGRNAVDAAVLEACGTAADGEIAWSWRPDAGAKFWLCSKGASGATVANEHWFTEESAYKP